MALQALCSLGKWSTTELGPSPLSSSYFSDERASKKLVLTSLHSPSNNLLVQLLHHLNECKFEAMPKAFIGSVLWSLSSKYFISSIITYSLIHKY